MNRKNALTIQHTQEIEDYLKANKLYYNVADKCPQLNEHVIFIDKPFIELLEFKPNIIANFKCYFDDGNQEVALENNQYKDCDLEDFYLVRSKKYDVIEELI